MINLRIIARILGVAIVIEGLFMLLPAAVSLLYGETTASSFLFSALITVISGAMIFNPLKESEKLYGNREGYIVVIAMWILLILFGTLPWILSGSVSNFADAFFETVAGFTTTAASAMSDVEALPKGLLFWRSLTQWLGGLGIILISLSVLPVVKSVNVQLTPAEFSSQQGDKIHPRIVDAAKRLASIYVSLTLGQTIMMLIGGVGLFDSVCHSLSTVSSGGFSTYNNGITNIATPYIKVVMTMFMFLAGTSMPVIYFAIKRNFRRIRDNNEFVFYAVVSVLFIGLVSVLLMLHNGYGPAKALREGSFEVVSVITTTGYYTSDHDLWSNALIIIVFTLMFTGGMAGSTSGGIKSLRLLLITKNNRQEMKRLIHPNAFIPVRLDNHIVSNNLILFLLVFIILYFITLCIGAFFLSIMDYDIITSFSTSASMLANIGPGLGKFGPFENFSAMPVQGKLFLSFLMLLGRLEIMSLLLVLTRGFYRL